MHVGTVRRRGMIGVSYGTDVTIVPIRWPTAKRGSEEDNADNVLIADMIDVLFWRKC
jgi:hypothetical protein